MYNQPNPRTDLAWQMFAFGLAAFFVLLGVAAVLYVALGHLP